MNIFNLFTKKSKVEKNSSQPKNWREAMAAECSTNTISNDDIPKLSRSERPILCSDLHLSEKTRIKLENLIADNYYDRSESLVDYFFAIIEKDGANLELPIEIYDLLNSKRKRGTCTDKQVAEVYIRHESEKIRSALDKKRFKEIGVTHVIIRTSEDQRVCPICKKHSNKKYRIDDAPEIPMCWDCRCYYEAVIR